MAYRVHHVRMGMQLDQMRLEQFLNSLDGEVVAIIPNVLAFPAAHVSYVLVVEKVRSEPKAAGGAASRS